MYAPSGLRAGTTVEVDGELMHVWSTLDDNRFQVERGLSGTVVNLHQTDALVHVAPRWPLVDIARGLRREIRSWPPALCAVVAADLSVAGAVEALELEGLDDVNVTRVLRVQRRHHDGADASWPTFGALLERRQSVDSFASGLALRFPHTLGTASTLRVVLGYDFPTTDGAVDFTVDIGTAHHLTRPLADAAMLGVAGRLLLTSETARTADNAQPRPRRGEDVPPGHRLQAGQALLVERDRLLKTELERLHMQYAPRY